MNPKLTSGQRWSVAISTAVFFGVVALILAFVRTPKTEPGLHLLNAGLDPNKRLGLAFAPVTASEVPQLLEALENWDTEVRYLAAFRLARLGAPAVGPLVSKLSSTDPQVRWWAAVTLGMIGLPATNAVASLTPMLRDDDGDVRAAALYALAQTGSAGTEATFAIIGGVKNGTLPVPFGASFFPDDKKVPGGQVCTFKTGGYKWFGQPRQKAAPRTAESRGLMSSGKDFIQVEVRLNAEGVYGALGDSAVPVLIELLVHPDENLRNFAANALAKVGAPAVMALANALRDTRAEVREKAALALGMIGPDAQAATSDLIAMLESETPNPPGHCRGCAAVAFALYHIGTNSVPPLFAVLSSDNPTASVYAADALGAIKPKSQDEINRLISAFGDSRKHVRASAALVLGELGPAAHEAVPALEAALGANEPFDVMIAASTLERIEPEADRGTKELVRMLKDEQPHIRRSAAEALEGLGTKATNSCPALVQALSDSDERVAFASINALRTIGLASPEVLDGLLRALKGPPRNRNAAALTLGLMGKPAIPGLIGALKDTDPDVRRWAAFAMGQLRDGAEALPALTASLEDEIEYVRREAAEAIGRIGQTWPNANGERQKSSAVSAVPKLIGCLTTGSPYLKRTAAEALGNIAQSDAATVAALKALLSDESVEVRRAAVFSLESLGHVPKEAQPILEEVARDPKTAQWMVTRATRLLEKIKSRGAE